MRAIARWLPLIIVCCLSPRALGEDLIRVLILSGQNNHPWEYTTPYIESILNETGLFIVRTTFHPQDLTPERLADVDVLLSEWNAFPRQGEEPAVTEWPESAREAYVNFVRQGGGHVTVHAGGSSFYDWDDYHAINLMRWGMNTTSHGPQHTFPLRWEKPEHPILQGLAPFAKWDELWKAPEIHADALILASSYSSTEDRWENSDAPIDSSYEPSVFISHFGKGRCFTTTLGHNVQAMEDPRFKTLLARGVEWAATGEVTLPANTFELTRAYTWEQTEQSLALKRGSHVVWRFNAGLEDSKPSFHPLTLPDGSWLTGFRPDDHTWHRGAWYAWKFLNEKNFWEENTEGRSRHGDTLIRSVNFQPQDDYSASIVLEIDYVTHEGSHFLSEERNLQVSAPDAAGGYQITSRHRFAAVQHVVINDYFYGGFSLRMLEEQRQDWTFIDAQGNTWQNPQSTLKEFKYPFILTGPPSPWVAFVEHTEQPTQGVAILDHSSNLRHPARWLILPDMPFFSPIVHYKDDITLQTGDTLELNYQILIFTDQLATPFVQQAQENFNTL